MAKNLSKPKTIEEAPIIYPISQEHKQVLAQFTQERNQAVEQATLLSKAWRGLMSELAEIYGFPFNSKTTFHLSDEGLQVIQPTEE